MIYLANANVKPQLLLAVAINCFPSRVYGEFEFWLSSLKVMFILSISMPNQLPAMQ